MEALENDIPAPVARPRTLTVIIMVSVFAVIFSYLVAFAVTGALVSAEVIKRWPSGSDPRPKWFLITFLVLTSTFALFGGLARLSSRRQLRKIDAMEDAELPIDHSATP